jgi:hypothetical protein
MNTIPAMKPSTRISLVRLAHEGGFQCRRCKRLFLRPDNDTDNSELACPHCRYGFARWIPAAFPPPQTPNEPEHK